MNELVVSRSEDGLRIGLLQNKKIVELHHEKLTEEFSVGDLFLGRVKKIVPGLNAAFVEVGHPRDAFLHYFDLGPQVKSLLKYIKAAKNPRNGRVRDLKSIKPLPDINKHGKMEEVLYGLVMYSVTGSKEDAFELCNTKEVVAEALKELPPHVKSKSAKIALQALPEVFANRKKLSQLFQHLITFSMAHQDSPSSTICISGEEKGELYEFCIRNSGTRISSEKASELFKIFTGKEEGEYTGLELAVSRKIVEQHKGRLWINTHNNEGTSFYFAIPKEEYLESDPAK